SHSSSPLALWCSRRRFWRRRSSRPEQSGEVELALGFLELEPLSLARQRHQPREVFERGCHANGLRSQTARWSVTRRLPKGAAGGRTALREDSSASIRRTSRNTNRRKNSALTPCNRVGGR